VKLNGPQRAAQLIAGLNALKRRVSCPPDDVTEGHARGVCDRRLKAHRLADRGVLEAASGLHGADELARDAQLREPMK